MAVSCYERCLANWSETDRRPLSRAACRRPTAGSRPWAFRNAGRGPAMHGSDLQSHQAEHQHELEVARLNAVVAEFPAAGGEASRFPSSCRRDCRGADGSRRRRSRAACGRDSIPCAVPWETSSGLAERANRPILLEADGCRQARHEVRAILERAPPRSAGCGRSLASRSKSAAPRNPRGIPPA